MCWTISRRQCTTMSTDRKTKRKRPAVRLERIKIIEYVSIGLVILLFLGMAICYGNRKSRNDTAEAAPTVSPEPTDDPSVRGMHVFSALEKAGFFVEKADDGYTVTADNGVVFQLHMKSDDKGIVQLSVETPFCPDPEEEGAVFDALREENRKTEQAIRDLFDAVMPVFHRPISDSETVVKQSAKVVGKGETYAKHLGQYSLRILSDTESVPQTVCISLIRDS